MNGRVRPVAPSSGEWPGVHGGGPRGEPSVCSLRTGSEELGYIYIAVLGTGQNKHNKHSQFSFYILSKVSKFTIDLSSKMEIVSVLYIKDCESQIVFYGALCQKK